MKRCTHRNLSIKTEKDRCSWVTCNKCKKRGPAKHSQTLALLGWICHIANQHPRAK
jgi:hypothetical protein